MITTAQNNDSVGVERFVYKDKFEEVARPFWLRPNFVKKRVIDEVVMREEGGEEDLRALGKKIRSKKQEAASGSIMAEAQDREELARGIVDRVNTRNKQYMNKSRENARADFLSKIGFLWHSSNGSPRYDCDEIPGLEDEDLDVTPITNVYPSDQSPVEIRSRNLKKWQEMLEKFRDSMSVVVECEVNVFKTSVGSGPAEVKTLRKEVSFMTAAISFCTKYTNCVSGDDFLVMHTSALKTIFAVACTFRAMVQGHMMHPFFISGDVENLGTRGDGRNMETLIYGLIPPTEKARDKVLNSVHAMTAEQFAKLHITDDAQEGEDDEQEAGHAGCGDSEEEPEDDGNDEEVDEELLKMQNINFRSAGDRD